MFDHSQQQEPIKSVGFFEDIGDISDMIIDDHNHFLLAGWKGVLEVNHKQSDLHLGEWIHSMARINKNQYLLGNA